MASGAFHLERVVGVYPIELALWKRIAASRKITHFGTRGEDEANHFIAAHQFGEVIAAGILELKELGDLGWGKKKLDLVERGVRRLIDTVLSYSPEFQGAAFDSLNRRLEQKFDEAEELDFLTQIERKLVHAKAARFMEKEEGGLFARPIGSTESFFGSNTFTHASYSTYVSTWSVSDRVRDKVCITVR